MKYDYNLAIIGGGTAGLVSAQVGVASRARTLLIEKHRMGGDCLNTGCVPSKALIRAAGFVHEIGRHQELGLRRATVEFDFAEVMERVQKVIARIEPHDSAERYRSLGVDVEFASARLRPGRRIQIGNREISARGIIIATGATPFIPELPGIQREEFLHSENVWELREKPGRLAILGGGAIGCELAQSFQRLGVSVLLIEREARLLPTEDEIVSDMITESLRADGVEIYTGFSAVAVEQSSPGKSRLVLEAVADGERQSLEFDRVLAALGRRPRTGDFGLEEAGVAINERGFIRVDRFGRTTARGIYACGDVVGPFQFTHVAAHQATSAALNALFGFIPFAKRKLQPTIPAWCTFTDPEIARAGLSETEARARNIAYDLTRYDLDELDRAIIENRNRGFIQVLTARGRDRILGVTIVGPGAGELLGEFNLAMSAGLGLKHIMGALHPYPTLSEASWFTAIQWRKRRVPAGLYPLLEFLQKRRR